ncbi:MAG: DUF374 domain-containing protein [Deltaproteobacteria bacterium]|nr:DUF374 domain-containing protein [Deltaproteobacteria bacterium]
MSSTGSPSPAASRSRRRRGPVAEAFRTHVRPIFSKRLSRLAAAVVPVLYVLYMRFVWATSRVSGQEDFCLNAISAQRDGAVALLWHEEVFTVAFGYPYIGIRGHTLASVGESGEVITRMLKLCGYVVFRGGSSTSRARRRSGVLEEMIAHMRQNSGVIYGLTVDGSKGPRYRMKTGGIIIARECNKPIALVRTWYRRCLRMKTWDRMAVPLPFNEIRYYLRGPYHVPEDTRTDEGLACFRLKLENDLIEIAEQSYRDARQPAPAKLVKRSPDEAPDLEADRA